MTKPISPAVAAALETRVKDLKRNQADPAKAHRFHPLREHLLSLRRKFSLSYDEITAEVKAAGVDDVTPAEVKNYYRLIGATRTRKARKGEAEKKK
jgi:hypothetical protein